MIRLTGGGSLDYRRMAAAIRRAEIRSLAHAAAAIRVQAVRGIKQTPRNQPSAPGAPPHTRKGQLRRAILYALLEENGFPAAIVGPSFDLVGLSGKAHEFGGHFKGADYPKRPFMAPALKVIETRLPAFFDGSLRET